MNPTKSLEEHKHTVLYCCMMINQLKSIKKYDSLNGSTKHVNGIDPTPPESE